MNPASLIGHAAELLRLIDGSRQPPDRIVAGFLRERHYLGARDRRAVSESVYGMIRNRRYLEALLEEFFRTHPEHADIADRPTRYLLLYLIFTSAPVPGHPSAPPSQLPAIPDGLWSSMFPGIDREAMVAWIAARADLGFLPDTSAADAAVRLGVRYSFQDWMVEAWLRQYPAAEAEELMRSLNEPARPVLRVNTLKTTRDACRARLGDEGVAADPTPLAPDGLAASRRFPTQSSGAFREGLFELQDEGSQLVAVIADPKPGEHVLDICAGAGGKSLHMAALMGNTGSITAMDVDERRLHELMERAKRAGARVIEPRLSRHGADMRGAPAADLVLVDAPCTGVGTIRRNPGLKWSVSEEDVGRHAARQKELLRSSAGLAAPGGRLVYVTCSLLAAENEEVVGAFLAAHPEFSLSPPTDPVPVPPCGDGFYRLLPHRHGTDGFFVAVLRRAAAF